MVWQKLKESLRDVLAENIFALWVEPLECVRCDQKQVVLACPDRFYRAHVERHYKNLMQTRMNEIDGVARQVVFCEAGQKNLPAPSTASQLRLPHVPLVVSSVRSLHPRYTFEEFMDGDSNRLALSACKAMVSGTDLVGPCLYINSSTGLGKSHLTHAVAHRILATSPGTRLHYLTAQQFSTEMVREIQAHNMDRFKQKYHDQCDVLLVEDVHSLTGKKKTQEELNELLDSLIKGGKRVILTANNSPRNLDGIDHEFRSRMTSGLVTAIEPPDIVTRQRIARKKAEAQGLQLEDDFVTFIAQHIRGDVRQLESAICAIHARSALMGGEIGMALVRDVVEGVVGAPRDLSSLTIGEMVGCQFRVTVKDMQSRSRKKEVVFPRQIAMYLSRLHTSQSLADIGKAFGRDHATVLHAIKVVTDRINRDASLASQMDILNKRVKQI